MKKQLVIVGIIVLLLAVGLSGCISPEKETNVYWKETCPRCGGSGEVCHKVKYSTNEPPFYRYSTHCDICSVCHGHGYIQDTYFYTRLSERIEYIDNELDKFDSYFVSGQGNLASEVMEDLATYCNEEISFISVTFILTDDVEEFRDDKFGGFVNNLWKCLWYYDEDNAKISYDLEDFYYHYNISLSKYSEVKSHLSNLGYLQ